MDYKNDNRTPRDRITGEFLSELLFTELGGDMNNSVPANNVKCASRRSSSGCRCGMNDSGICKTVPEVRCDFPRRDCRKAGNDTEIVGNYSLAMAYVQMQKFDDLFDIDKGFMEGTIFKGLRFPFYPTPCRKECD